MRKLSLALLLFASAAHAQTTGTGPTVLQNGATLNPANVDQVRYADQYSGNDIGAKVNAAIGTCAGQCEIRLPAGTFDLATTITVSSPGISIVGAGMSATILQYVGTTQALSIKMAPTTPTPAGRFSGFTINGKPHASGIAIRLVDTIGAHFEDIEIYGFDQIGAIGLSIVNETKWNERNQFSHVSIQYSSTAVQFEVAGSTSNSFGYNRFEDLAITVGDTQTGIHALGGTFYNGTLTMTCNIDNPNNPVAGCIVLEAGSNWNNNVYQITGEAKVATTGIHVKAGGGLHGYGSVVIANTTKINDNAPSYNPSFRILPGASALDTVLDGGKISNFLVPGNTATVYPQLMTYGGYANFGFLTGTNTISPYVAMYDSAPNNAFMIYKYGYQQSPNQMTPLARFDGLGNLHVLGAVYTGGADYAESLAARKDIRAYEPGDVLAVSRNDGAELELSSETYSTRVAGIFSTQPGILGGSSDVSGSAEPNEKVPLAIHGIVPCKVSAENGAITPGDLLVSSRIPGYAMKGTKRDAMLGAVVGKAMGTLKKGTGTIPVLVTLQ
jgi:hypothetical protein